jgi:hypothetical protein
VTRRSKRTVAAVNASRLNCPMVARTVTLSAWSMADWSASARSRFVELGSQASASVGLSAALSVRFFHLWKALG